MKKYKIIGMISASLITLGIVLIFAGYANGGSLYHNAFGFYSKNGYFFGINFNGDVEQQISKKTKTYTYKNLNSMEISMEIGKVQVLIGDDDTFEIDCINIPEKYIHQKQNGGALEFEVTSANLNFSNPKYQIIVTIPKNANLTNLDISSDTGSIEADSLKAEHMELSSDTGTIEVKALQAATLSLSNDTGTVKIGSIQANSLDMDVDTGKADIDKLDCAVLKVDSDTGTVKINGITAKQITLDNDTGKIECQIIGKQDSYSYDIKNDIGKVNFGSQHFGTDSSESNRDHGANLITISNDVGSVTVHFTK